MKKTLHIMVGTLAAIVVLVGNQEQVANDIEKVVGNKKSVDELTTSELINTIDVLKKHIMA